MTHDNDFRPDDHPRAITGTFRSGSEVSPPTMPDPFRDPTLVELASEIVAAYVRGNSVPPSDIPALLSTVHATLAGLGRPVAEVSSQPLVPAVPIRKSVTDDYIVCLEDGRKFKSLRRHLALLGMTPAEYRVKWGLPADYPMVAPAYGKVRSALAKETGLGQKRRAA